MQYHAQVSNNKNNQVTRGTFYPARAPSQNVCALKQRARRLTNGYRLLDAHFLPTVVIAYLEPLLVDIRSAHCHSAAHFGKPFICHALRFDLINHVPPYKRPHYMHGFLYGRILVRIMRNMCSVSNFPTEPSAAAPVW